MEQKKEEKYKVIIMTNKEIENKRNKLIEIVNMSSGTGDKRRKELRELALEVGASHRSIEDHKAANEGELVVGIQAALQTTSMLNACKATKTAWIVALFSALASMISAIAAWAAILSKSN